MGSTTIGRVANSPSAPCICRVFAPVWLASTSVASNLIQTQMQTEQNGLCAKTARAVVQMALLVNHVQVARLAKLVVVGSLASAQATRHWWCSSCPVETVLLLPWLLNQLPQAGFYCIISLHSLFVAG